MYKVEWNKEHTWKVVKYYKNGKLKKFKFGNSWYWDVYDHSCIDYDECGNRYIACDGCANCELEDACKCDNPIQNACGEFDKISIHLEHCLPPHKTRKLTNIERKILSKEEIEDFVQWQEENS